MTRQDFIGYFENNFSKDKNEYFSDFFCTLNLNYLLNNIDNDGVLGLLYVNSKLDDIYNDLNISKPYYLKKDELFIEYDWDYNDENPDSDDSFYRSSINLNNLYDNLVLNNSIKNDKLIDIYRIEESNGSGLYNGIGYKILLNAPEYNHQSPEKEPKFFDIFSNRPHLFNEKYKKTWNFAFKDFEQIKLWLDNSVVLNLLKESNFVLKKLTINENSTIIGDFQAIYRKDGIKSIEILPLDSLDEIFNIKQKKIQKKAPSI